MHSMAINRRGFLAGAAALGCATAAHAAPIRTRLISAARRPGGTDELAIWSRNTGIDAPLAARGHGLAAFGGGGPYAIAARRPGAFVAIVEPSGQITERHAPVTGHIFAGHVLPVSRTRTFLATEIEAESGNGFAVLRRIGQKTPLAQWETVGLGPHDLTVLDGGARLVIANGGLETAEDHAGSMVDPDTIESSLALLDSHDGRLIRKVELDRTLRSLSIRHMAPSPDGRHVAFGMQDKKKDVWRPLVGVMDIDGRVELFDAPRDDSDALRGYVGSVAIDTSATYLAVTSPRGGRIEAWTLSDGRSVGGLSLQDVCGLAADHRPGTFWATTGLGEIKRIEISPAGLAIRENYSAPLAFDNHLVLV